MVHVAKIDFEFPLPRTFHILFYSWSHWHLGVVTNTLGNSPNDMWCTLWQTKQKVIFDRPIEVNASSDTRYTIDGLNMWSRVRCEKLVSSWIIVISSPNLTFIPQSILKTSKFHWTVHYLSTNTSPIVQELLCFVWSGLNSMLHITDS